MAMRYEEIKALFDQQAAGYDKQWAGMAPIREALYLLLDALFWCRSFCSNRQCVARSSARSRSA